MKHDDAMAVALHWFAVAKERAAEASRYRDAGQGWMYRMKANHATHALRIALRHRDGWCTR